MSGGAQAALLPDGRRLHLHHGPIDLIVDVIGAPRQPAYARAARRFATILEELVTELPALRQPLGGYRFTGPVACRMARAVAPFQAAFVTPMAAVAGAVADEMLETLVAETDIPKAYVNNGGDIAVHLSPGQVATSLGPAGGIQISADQPARGLATSGWRGRSYSRGIADAVTVCAKTAAAADVAATLIANAVDLPGHPAICRIPACDLSPESDLGTRLVTTGVGDLTDAEVRQALSRGQALAAQWAQSGLVHDAALTLKDVSVTLLSHQEGDLVHG